VTNLHATLTGEVGLSIAADDSAIQLEPHTYANDAGPLTPDGGHLATGWIARIPVTLDPTKPWDIGGDRYPFTIAATYSVAGESQPRTFNARVAIDAEVASAIYQMAIAAAILPLLCLIAAWLRWRRTR
jgi:hypothetical protein